jgi:hypothetical protein
MPNFDNMLNRKLASVVLDKSRDVITFSFQDGFERRFSVEGDCCSHSWIEHLEMPGDIVGATLLSVDDSGPVVQDHDEHDEEQGGGCISVYNTSFKTDRGEIILEYRNSSNGYYGGYLVEA